MAPRILIRRLRALFSDPRIDEEIATHLSLQAAEYERRGMSPERAEREARRQFGGASQVAEAWREQRSLPFIETLAKDLRYAARQLRTNPGFAAAAVMTLALGIGANTAIFRVLDAVVLRSLPVRHPEQLVLLEGSDNGRRMSFSYPLFREIAARQQVVEGMFAVCDFPMKDAVLPGSTGRLVTGGYFQLLGVDAALGRMLTGDDDRPSAPPVAVISHGFWQRAFAGRADALGKTMQIGQAVVTIVGVSPPEFFGERVGSAPDVWLPMNLSAQVWVNLPKWPPAGYLTTVMARLRPDVTMTQAESAFDLLYGQLTDFHVRLQGGDRYRLELQPGGQGVRDLQKKFARPLLVLSGIVGLVLLIACSNLANLLLARSAARTHEMGVRLALGAARGRLIRQLLTESSLLALFGSVLGFILAAWGSRALVTMASAGQNWQLSLDVGWRAIGFTSLLSGLAVSLFGLAPALAATRLDVHSALQAHGRSQFRGRSQNRVARVFLVAQVAISLLLVAGASLLVRSFWNLAHQDFGYRQEGVLWVRIPFDRSFRAQLPLLPAIYERLNGIPGVRSVGLAATGPLGNIQDPGGLSLPGRPAPQQDEATFVKVSAGFFETLGIPILAGRPIDGDDRKGTAAVAVISQTAARKLFGAENPVGRLFTNGPSFDPGNAMRIVGVAHDIRYANPRDPFGMVVYEPLAQESGPLTSVMLRTAGDPALFATAVRKALREVTPGLQIAEIRPLSAIVGTSLGQERIMALLSGAFGLLALVLACVGLYGVIAYGVERRTQEIGIRLALGAGRGEVVGLLLGEVALVLAIGLGIGGAAAIPLGQSLRALLFGLTPHDPAMLIGSAAMLSMVALAAGYLPARRAARLNPMNALRQE